MSNSQTNYPDEYLCNLTELGLIQISGEDAKTFLQGQVSSDVNALNKHQAQLSCHCDFKGKTWNNFHIVDFQNDLLLVGDQSAHQRSFEQLKKYSVFSKIELSDVSAEWQIFGGYGETLEQLLAEKFGDTPIEHNQVFKTDDAIVICFAAPLPRFLLIVKQNAAAQWLQQYPQQIQQDNIWHLLDIQAGMPQISASTSNEFVPQMLNMHLLGAISFTKGCYMGQEVVARTKYLGKNKRSCFVLKADDSVDVTVGDTLESQVGDNWRRGGTVINQAQYQNQTWLLAVLASDTEEAATLRVKHLPDHHFRVRPLPYPLDEH